MSVHRRLLVLRERYEAKHKKRGKLSKQKIENDNKKPAKCEILQQVKKYTLINWPPQKSLQSQGKIHTTNENKNPLKIPYERMKPQY